VVYIQEVAQILIKIMKQEHLEAMFLQDYVNWVNKMMVDSDWKVLKADYY